VLVTVFVLGPAGMIALNEVCGWPRWQSGVAQVAGAGVMFAGVGVAVYCARLFSRLREGSPVPTEPPQRLVVAGFYRYSRNPMYVADVLILLGLFLHRGELALLLYAGLFALAAHAWIVWHEEPVLRLRFGEAYARYLQAVPRWVLFRPRVAPKP
jgi:protein-S-isoprenylcysteine O-methyltransferase Ste14